MFQYIVRRSIAALVVLLGVSIFTFGLVRFIPGDPIQLMLGPDAFGADAEGIRELYGLNRPWMVQYIEWLGNVFRGNMGVSIRNKLPIGQAILDRIPVTLELTLLSFLLGLLIGIPLAIIAASNREKATDALLGFITMLGISMPGFWLATLLMLLLSLQFRLLPSIGFVNFTDNPLENIRHIIMPALGLALPLGATIMRFMRSSLLEVLGSDFLRTARAKGLSVSRATLKHAVRNALIPVITVAGIQIGRLLGGAVIIEQIFALPGLGRFTFDGILNRDYPVVQGAVLVFTFFFIFTNLVVDIVYGLVDPRIKLVSGRAG
jgi:peptide/nickel transport system permease protein